MSFLTMAALEDERVIDLRTVAELCDLSLATLRRRIEAGQGPRVTRVSERRVGVRVAHLKAWLDQREEITA
jgi:predicted DNA-binding transcriptional regulator AlpA